MMEPLSPGNRSGEQESRSDIPTAGDHCLTMPDWISELASHAANGTEELDLTSLKAGDLLIVKTLHTEYCLTMTGNHQAELEAARADRFHGPIQIQGCSFGASSTIKPEAIFCGGNLEYTSDGGTRTHTTSTILSLCMIRQKLRR